MLRCLVLGPIVLEGLKTLILTLIALKSRPTTANRESVLGRITPRYMKALESTKAARGSQPQALKQPVQLYKEEGRDSFVPLYSNS